MDAADFLIIGGGIAGVSAAARLAPHGRTIVLEAEEAFGYHSSGRSAAYYHFGIGDSVVRGMTAFSRPYFKTKNHIGADLSCQSPALFIASPDMLDALSSLEQNMRRFSDLIRRVGESEIKNLVPVLKCGGDNIVAGVLDHTARRLDSEAMQQGYRAQVKEHGGACKTNSRVVEISREGSDWVVTTQSGVRYAAPIIVNAAGAWCDEIARLADVKPLGLHPLRRTMICFDPPSGHDVRNWPFTKTVVDDFYMLPESGRLLACPVDEVPTAPTDAQPEEYDIALAASKVEDYTNIPIRRIDQSWAGLRTFTKNRVPVAGFAPDADGFFWLAGQGGYGLQTAPAMSVITEALITGMEWPEGLTKWGVNAEVVAPWSKS
jgi:D-arginine dehydrogenase